MKKLLFSLAFVVAVAAAFAWRTPTNYATANLYKKVSGNCTLVQCATTGQDACEVETGTTLYTATECPKTNPTAYGGNRYEPF